MQTHEDMDQGDECMRLATAVLGVEPKDGRQLMRTAAQTQTDIAQQVLETTGRMGVGEELDRVFVLLGSIAAQDLSQVGGEIRLGNGALANVLARLTKVEDRR